MSTPTFKTTFTSNTQPLRAFMLAVLYALAAVLAWPAGAQQSESFVKRDTQMRAAPGKNGAVVEDLSFNAPVEPTGERKGSWIQIRTMQGTSGWVHQFDVGVRGGTASADNGIAASGGLRTVGGLFGGSKASSTATATVGVRGIGNGAPIAQPAAASAEDSESESESESENENENEQ